jgi:spermidine synthase
MAASPGESPGKEPVPPPAQEKAPEEGESVPPGPGEDKARASLMRTVLLAFFISGFTSMVYQVCWSRALALSFGSSVYSFSTILVTFLSGIALGSFIFSHSGIFRQDRIKPSTLGDTELLIGVLSLAIMPFLGMMPFVFLKLFPLLQGSHWMLIAGNFLISFLVILPPTILIGVTFPMVLKIYTQDIQNLGRKTGEVYASNTTGNIVGSFMAGFVLIPVMGVENSLKLSVALNLLAAVMIYAASPSTKKTPAWILRHAVVIVSVVVLVFGQFWKHSAMSLGVSIYARHYAQVKTLAQFRSLAAIEASNIVYYRDGISSTVTVIHSGDLVGLKVNGKNDASYSPKGTDDMHTQWLQGFVPTLLHQNPKRVCVIGFGSGITCGAVSQFEGIEIIDSVEIEPVVMEAAKYFAEGNLNVVSSPAFRNHIADGRNFILASRKKYDVIISEPSNPWIAGIGNLFSTDFYRICLDRLEDDGVYCQWIQTYGMTPDTVKMVLNTFFSVFPRGSVWITQRGDLMLIGGKKDPVLDYQRLSEIMKKNPRVRDYMKLITYTSPRQLLAIRITDADRVRAFTAGSRINTDDLPFLEFEAPRNIYAEIDRMNIARSLMQYRPEGISFDWARNLDGSLMEDPGFYNDLGDVYSRLELWDQARELYRAAVAKSPAFGKAYVGWAWAEEKSKNPLRAVQVLREASRAVPRFEEAYLLRIDLLKRAGAFREGAAACREALKEMPESYVFLNQLVVMLIQDGDFKEALAPAEKLLALYPGAVPYQLYLARIFNGLGSPAKAEEAYRYILRGQPDNVIALDGLGDALASRKAWKEASEAYQAALKVSPGSIPTALKLAEAHEKAGLTDKARDVYFDILRQNPDVPQARMGLGRMSRQE